MIDQTDAKIITQLQIDGRRSNVEIARRVGAAEATVRKRIERLVRDRVIQIGASPDPLKIGYQTYALIRIQTGLRHIERVAQRLAKETEVFFLGTCTGDFDIVAAACFRSNAHIHEFMTKRLAAVPGVQRTTTVNITRVEKREYQFPIVVDGDQDAAREAPRKPRRSRRARSSAGTTSRPLRRMLS